MALSTLKLLFLSMRQCYEQFQKMLSWGYQIADQPAALAVLPAVRFWHQEFASKLLAEISCWAARYQCALTVFEHGVTCKAITACHNRHHQPAASTSY